MPRTAERKLTSEERAEKSYREWYEPHRPHIEALAQDPDLRNLVEQVGRASWLACWLYLESRVEEFVKS